MTKVPTDEAMEFAAILQEQIPGGYHAELRLTEGDKRAYFVALDAWSILREAMKWLKENEVDAAETAITLNVRTRAEDKPWHEFEYQNDHWNVTV